MTRSRFTSFAISVLALTVVSGLDLSGSEEVSEKGVTVRHKTQPFYPQWAYNNGIGSGYAKVAFYVDEAGEPSEFLVLEYSHQAFVEELLKAVTAWDFIPAHRAGEPINSVCHAYWEFHPDRPIYTNALFDTAKRVSKSGDSSFRALRSVGEEALDAQPRMIYFPEIIAPDSFDSSALQDGKVAVTCEFYLDPEGQVALPVILGSSAPGLNPRVLAAFKQCLFERPSSDGKAVVAVLRKTYLLTVTVTP